jgi:hypothetical protein
MLGEESAQAGVRRETLQCSLGTLGQSMEGAGLDVT